MLRCLNAAEVLGRAFFWGGWRGMIKWHERIGIANSVTNCEAQRST